MMQKLKLKSITNTLSLNDVVKMTKETDFTDKKKKNQEEDDSDSDFNLDEDNDEEDLSEQNEMEKMEGVDEGSKPPVYDDESHLIADLDDEAIRKLDGEEDDEPNGFEDDVEVVDQEESETPSENQIDSLDDQANSNLAQAKEARLQTIDEENTPSNVRRQPHVKQVLNKIKNKRMQQIKSNFFDDDAELGSDDENNDVAKPINRDDE